MGTDDVKKEPKKKAAKKKEDKKESKVKSEAELRKEIEEQVRADIAAEAPAVPEKVSKKCDPVTFIWNENKKLRAITMVASEDLVTAHGLTRNPKGGRRITVKESQYVATLTDEVEFLREHKHYESTRPEGFQEISDKEVAIIRKFHEQGKMFKSNIEAIKEARNFVKMSADLKDD